VLHPLAATARLLIPLLFRLLLALRKPYKLK
jgi:hypothetical protein